MKPRAEKWDVWLSPFRYEDSEDIKIRPVLIYEDNIMWLVSFKITTHPPRSYCEGEYAIQDWKEAGLRYPSVIRCTKKAILQQNNLIKKLGRLSMLDIKEVSKVLNAMYKDA